MFNDRACLQILELGRMIINLINVLPDGIVCFFPSYEYEGFVYELWKDNDVIRKFENKKKVINFTEKSRTYKFC